MLAQPETKATASVTFTVKPAEPDATGDWRERAMCRDYPHKRGEVDPFDISRDDPEWDVGKSFCHACPVKAECLEEALKEEGWKTVKYRSGLRGGLTPKERVNLKIRTARREKRQENEAA